MEAVGGGPPFLKRAVLRNASLWIEEVEGGEHVPGLEGGIGEVGGFVGGGEAGEEVGL